MTPEEEGHHVQHDHRQLCHPYPHPRPLPFDLSNLAPFNKALLLALAFRWAGAKMVKKAKKYLSDERTSEPKG